MNAILNQKKLAVFDFDYTVVDDNSDIVVRNLLDPSDVVKFDKNEQNWTEYMQSIFDKLHEKNITQTTMLSAIKSIKPVDGMKGLIQSLNEDFNFDIIIVSDANGLFIETWLRCAGLRDHILEIFSNPAQFDETGKLNIQPFHEQYDCQISPVNLCKGEVMENFIKKQHDNNVNYSNAIYIGDGSNDFCPMLRLNSQDYAFPRAGYNCEKIVDLNQKRVPSYPTFPMVFPEIKAQIFVWSSGEEIRQYLYEQFGFYKY